MGLSELPDASGLRHEKAFRSLGWVTRRTAEHVVMTTLTYSASPSRFPITRLSSVPRCIVLFEPQALPILTFAALSTLFSPVH